MEDAEKKEKIQQERKRKSQKERDDVMKVMESPEGRRFVYKMIQRAGVFRSSFNGQSNTTIFNEGNRNQGLMLLADVTKYAPGSYDLMMKENRDE